MIIYAYRKSALPVLLVIFCCTLVSAQDDPRRLLLRQQAEGIDLSPDWRGVVVDWTAMNEMGTSRNAGIPRDKVFEVVKLGEFQKTQQSIQDIAGKYGRLELLHGTPCFIPANITDSNMSVPVTLDLENVSTWEALKTVVRLVNCHRRFGDKTVLQVRTLGTMDIPEEFAQVDCITLKVVDVAARDAICMILAQAPLSVGLQSRNSYRPEMGPGKYWFADIVFYRGNQPIVGTEFWSKERSSFWDSEMKEAAKPAENCAENAEPSEEELPKEEH